MARGDDKVDEIPDRNKLDRAAPMPKAKEIVASIDVPKREVEARNPVRACTAIRVDGERCSNGVWRESDEFCWHHDPNTPNGLDPHNGKQGRKPGKSTRQMAEEAIAEKAFVYVAAAMEGIADAMTATKRVYYKGKFVQEVEDWDVRLRAYKMALDRGLGAPEKTVNMNHSGEVTQRVDTTSFAERAEQVRARKMAERELKEEIAKGPIMDAEIVQGVADLEPPANAD